MVVPPELSGVLELFTPQVADSGRHKRLQFLETAAPLVDSAAQTPRGPLPAAEAAALPNVSRGPLERLFGVEARQEELIRQVISRLQLDPTLPAYLLDLGCSSSAAALQVARRHPRFTLEGLTLLSAVAEQALADAVRFGMSRRLRFRKAELTATGEAAAICDGLYAIDSARLDYGVAKDDFVREASRLLKGNRRLVVADLFYQGAPTGPLVSRLAKRLHHRFGVETFPEIGAFTSALRRHGFADIRVERVSSGLLQASLQEPQVALLGTLARAGFGYFIVSARRRRL